MTPQRVSKFRLTHLPALDGLRGLAVLAVVLFHTGHLTGGYLGVDLFFVLSGFLITTLLLEERQDTGTIALKRFWVRRARRLLPALIAMLGGVALYAIFFADATELGRIRSDAFATLLYVANWHGVIAGQGYWDQFGPPSPLQHTWSLAIEEQFYVVWPLLLSLLLRWRRGSRRAVVAFAIAFAIAATFWMATVYDPLHTDRAYLGTDTRIPSLLLGAAFAAWLQWKGTVVSRRGRIAVEVAAVLGAQWLLLTWFLLAGGSAGLYRGGLFLCAVSVVALLAAVTHPAPGPVARVLAFRPLCWLGLISYGLYLWHWPIIVFLSPARTGLDGWSLTAVQVGVSLAIAVASYFLLEVPIRRHGLDALHLRRAAPVIVVVVALALLLGTRGAIDPVVRQQDDLAALAQQQDQPVGRLDPAVQGAKGTPLPRPDNRLPRVLVVGDSVGGTLAYPMEVDPQRWQVQVANRTILACTLDRDSGRTRSITGAPRQEGDACRQWPTRWVDDVSRFRPDAVLMIFGGLNGEPRLVDGEFRHPCDAYMRRWYRAEMDDALRILSAEGARVFVTPFTYSKGTGRPDANLTADCLNPEIHAAVDANPAAQIVPLDSWVCRSQDDCKETVDGVKLRFDDLHYRDKAADIVDRWILDQVVAPATAGTTPAPTPTGPTTTLPALPPGVMATVGSTPSR